MYIYIQTNRKYSIPAEINVGPRNKAKILIWLPLTIVEWGHTISNYMYSQIWNFTLIAFNIEFF